MVNGSNILTTDYTELHGEKLGVDLELSPPFGALGGIELVFNGVVEKVFITAKYAKDASLTQHSGRGG